MIVHFVRGTFRCLNAVKIIFVLLFILLALGGCQNNARNLGSFKGIEACRYALNGSAIAYYKSLHIYLLENGKSTRTVDLSLTENKPLIAYPYSMLISSSGRYYYYFGNREKRRTAPPFFRYLASPVELIQFDLSTKRYKTILGLPAQPEYASVDRADRKIAILNKSADLSKSIKVIDIGSGKSTQCFSGGKCIIRFAGWSSSGDSLRFIISRNGTISLMSIAMKDYKASILASNLPADVSTYGLCVDDDTNTIIYNNGNGEIISQSIKTNQKNVLVKLPVNHPSETVLSSSANILAVDYYTNENDQIRSGIVFLNMVNKKTYELSSSNKDKTIVFGDWHPKADKAIVSYNNGEKCRLEELNIGKILE